MPVPDMRPRVNCHRARRAHDLLGVGVAGLLAVGDEAVAGLELDVAGDVEGALVLADAGLLAGDDVVAAAAVVDVDLDADAAWSGRLVGDLALELDRRSCGALELDDVAAAGLDGGLGIEPLDRRRSRATRDASTRPPQRGMPTSRRCTPSRNHAQSDDARARYLPAVTAQLARSYDRCQHDSGATDDARWRDDSVGRSSRLSARDRSMC